MLKISKIKKSYKKQNVLSDISFCAYPGHCIGILGENGCGKSTLLSILAGATKPDSGSIQFDGLNFLPADPSRCGYVPQENPFIEGLTVLDHFLLWNTDSKKALEHRLQSGDLSLFDLYDVRNQRIETLSGGMKKRLSIACALSYDPTVLLLDEPTAALDLACKDMIRGYLKHFLSRNKIIILATHEEADFSLLTDAYHLKNGMLEILPLSDLSHSLKERMGSS